MAVTLTEQYLRGIVGAEDFRALTRNNPALGTESIQAGKIYVLSMFTRCGRASDYDETNPIIASAIIQRSAFELFVPTQQWKEAQIYKTQCQDLLIGFLGDCADIHGGDKPKLPTKTRSHLVKGRTDWYGYE